MMKLTPLVLGLLLVQSMPAFAVFYDQNIRGGLQFDTSVTVSPQLTQTKNRFSYMHGNPTVYDTYDSKGKVIRQGTMAQVLADQDRRDTDERARLSGADRVYVHVRATQAITRNVSLSSTLSLYGWNTGASLSTPSLTATHSKMGSVTVAINGGLSTTVAQPATTYRVLDSQGSSVSASFTKIPNFNLRAYYAFPASADTRLVSDAKIHSGYGVVASYTFSPNAEHTTTLGVGYTNAERHPDMGSESLAKYKDAMSVGIKHTYRDWTFSLDAGQSKQNLSGARLASVKTNVYGAKAEYNITPRLSTSLGYATSNAKKTATSGNPITYDDFIANRLGVNEALYFDKVKGNQWQTGLTYQLDTSVSLSATATKTTTKNELADAFFSKRDNTVYGVSASFTF